MDQTVMYSEDAPVASAPMILGTKRGDPSSTMLIWPFGSMPGGGSSINLARSPAACSRQLLLELPIGAHDLASSQG